MCKTKTSSSVVTSLIHQQVPYLNCIKANTEQQMLFQICESFLAYEAPPLDLFPLYFVTIVPNCGNTMSILTSLDPPFVEKEQANQSWVSQIHHIWNIFGGSWYIPSVGNLYDKLLIMYLWIKEIKMYVRFNQCESQTRTKFPIQCFMWYFALLKFIIYLTDFFGLTKHS